MIQPEPINLTRSILLCNLFHFFLAAAKASLLPFLTLYFRLLGLSALQTGIIMSGKTFVAFVWSPLWSRCATSCNKRRCILMFSILMMAGVYMTVTLVPSPTKSNNELWCTRNMSYIDMQNASHDGNGIAGNNDILGSTTIQPPDGKIPSETSSTGGILAHTLAPSTAPPSKTNEINPQVTGTKKPGVTPKGDNQEQINNGNKGTTTEGKLLDDVLLKPSDIIMRNKTTNKEASKNVDEETLSNVLEQLNAAGLKRQQILQLTTHEIFRILTDVQEFSENTKPLDASNMLSAIQEIKDDLAAEIGDDATNRRKRSFREDVGKYWDKVAVTVNDWYDYVAEEQFRVFIVVLVILMAGEIFCSGVDKVADDAWFDFLDSVDDMERYGKQRVWSSFANIIFPVAVTLIVTNTDCLLFFQVHHFVIHFYMFGALLGIAFLFALCYPVPLTPKRNYISKVGKGIRVVCCNCQRLLYVGTLLIMGMLYATYNNFLFWLLQDMGGSEVTMGMCVLIMTLSELPMLMFSEKLVKKVGNGGLLSIALFCLAIRLLYYSFLPTPWAVLPAELTHAFTHTGMWWAILSNPDLSISPVVDRSIRSILSTTYFGVGFATGSIIAGVIYDQFGVVTLFQVSSAVAIAWCVIFSLIHRCLPKKTVIKYHQLLQSDGLSDTEEDDWLETALKEH